MMSLKTVFLAITIFPLLFSCSKKEGCNYNEATNYDNEVVVDDGSCTFTNLTFYADTTHINGALIQYIDVKINNEIIGSFAGTNPFNEVCGGFNTASYNEDAGIISWTSDIYLLDTMFVTSGTSRTSPDVECLEINILP